MDWSFLIRNNDALVVSTDSRQIPAGCVFFAIKGENFDGNQFAASALEKGAAWAVVSDPVVAVDARYVLVENTTIALQELARDWRRYLGIQVIGITGTNGKTTTKELTASVLKTKYNLLYTQGNLNNSIGVPLTVLRMTREHNLALIEMGASHPGDIEELVNICEPNCGLITNVGKAHLQGFGSFEGVKKTKAELYDYLRAHGGFCFRNMDNPHLQEMAGDLQTIPYHTGVMPDGTHLVGEYNAENVSAALAVGEHFGISREEGLAAIRAYVPQNNRSQLLQTENNTVVVDAYNANVTSMTAAIAAFKGNTLILGDMLELGEYSHDEHQHIVDMIREKQFEQVYLIGGEFAATEHPYASFATVDELNAYLQEHPLVGRNILLKGSHGIHLEKAISML